MLEAGIKGKQTVTVNEENTARRMGSGTLDVFATPALIALMEETCWRSVADELDAGCGSVGTLLEIRHTAPTPVGMEVTCESELVEADGRRLVFQVVASDAGGVVGEGRHERFVVQNEKFQTKADAKRDA